MEPPDTCPICLESLSKGGLSLPCGHSLHASCLLSTFEEEPPGSWRCPCCRAVVDPGGVKAAAELPPEARGREFFRPPDLEGGSGAGAASPCTAGTAPSGGAAAAAAAGGKNPLVGLGRFMRAADMALQEEAAAAAAQPAADSGGTGAPAPTRRPLLRCSSWALRVVDRLLPQSAAHAAAAAYASVAVSQLLHPKAARGRGLCMAAALWLNSLALFGAGCAAGVLLLAQFMGAGVRLLCRANCLMAGALAMPAATPAVDCNGPGIGSPRWLVCIVCACAAVLVAESRRGGRPGGAALLLRLERHGPRLLLQLYLAVFLLAGNMLLLAFLFNAAAICTSWLTLAADGEPPGHTAAWVHMQEWPHP